MLCLSRRIGEEIVLTLPDGSLVYVRVLDIGSRNVRLGIEAEPSVLIVRGELMKREGKAS